MKVKLKGIKISHIATCLPKNVVPMSDYKEFFSEKDIKRIMESTGVESVHVADEKLCSSDYYAETAKRLMAESGFKPDDFDGIVMVFQTPDYTIPTAATIMQDRLGLPKSAVAFEINYGCTGYIYGIYQASLLISSGSCQRVLVFVGDTHVRTLHEEDRANRMILGDGFAVTILERGEDEFSFEIFSEGSGYRQIIIEAGGFRMPKSEETAKPIVDADGNTHWRNYTFMDGMAIMNFSLKQVPPLIEDSLKFAGWEKNSVGLFAFHQANGLILDFLRRRIKVEPERCPINMKNIGNTAGSSIPLMLSACHKNFSESQLEKVLMCGFGVGLSLGTAAVNLSNTKIYDTWEF